jgi:hypothetical protein
MHAAKVGIFAGFGRFYSRLASSGATARHSADAFSVSWAFQRPRFALDDSPIGRTCNEVARGSVPFWKRMGARPSLNTTRPFAHLQNSTYLCSINRGVEQLVARRAHNPKVVGSSPAPATQVIPRTSVLGIFLCPLGSTSKRRKTLTWCYYNRGEYNKPTLRKTKRAIFCNRFIELIR